MLKVGSTGIKSVYVGGQKIKKAYVGNALVFEEAKPSRLPAGYTEVEYIQKPAATGYYFNIPACSMDVTKITLDMELLSSLGGMTSDQCFFGSASYTSSVNRTYYFGVTGQSSAGIQTAVSSIPGSFTTITKTVTVPSRMVMTMDSASKTVSCNSSKITLSSISSSALSRFKNKMGIFNTALLNTSATAYPLGSSARIYSFTRQGSGGQLANNLVPCINPSGTVGLYDLASSAFISPAAGKFTAGPAV